MQLKKLLEKWDLDKLKINALFMEMEWVARDEDKNAAWELYVEMLTRVATQSLTPKHGQERAALESIYALFPITREIIKRHGRYCESFAKIAVVVLNQIVRPFTTKWHSAMGTADFLDENGAAEFRVDLVRLQFELRKYSRLLADMAGVEDLTSLESDG